jgi:hypothetical protein
MGTKQEIADLKRRVRELEQQPRTYPVYVPYYVGPAPVMQPHIVWPYTTPAWPYPSIVTTTFDPSTMSPTCVDATVTTGSEVTWHSAGYSLS